MANLIIERKHEWTSMARSYRIYVNGEKVGSIGNGQMKSFPLEPGKHIIQARIDWCGSTKHEIDLDNETIVSYRIASFKYAQLIPIIAIICYVIHVVLTYILGFKGQVTLVPFFLLMTYMFYYLTIGRNRYLRLIKD